MVLMEREREPFIDLECGNLRDSDSAAGQPKEGTKIVGEEERKEKVVGGEKGKKKGRKKPPRPPRPPRLPSLDAADQKLVREISELAMLKRARIERMKALKKMKNSKSGGSGGNFWALVITLAFCFVILWQGIFSKGSSNVSFHGSPESSMARGGLISVQFYNNVSTSRGSSSASPKNVEQVSGFDEQAGSGRVAE